MQQPCSNTEPDLRNDRRKGYKKRWDADYCSKKHANDHYYATVTKPKRDAERRKKYRGRAKG